MVAKKEWLTVAGMAVAGLSIVVGIMFQKQKAMEQPNLPLNVSMRKALMGSGLVAQIQNRGSSEIVVAVTVHGTKTNQQNSWRLVLPPGKTQEIGHMQGWAFASGDELEIQENGYRPMKLRVNG